MWKVYDVLRQMKHVGISPNSQTLEHIARLAEKFGHVASLEQTITDMASKNVYPNFATLLICVRMTTAHRQFEKTAVYLLAIHKMKEKISEKEYLRLFSWFTEPSLADAYSLVIKEYDLHNIQHQLSHSCNVLLF